MTDLAAIVLAKGNHDAECDNPERCLFEWYNWIVRDVHTDSCPPDVSPVLHEFGMRLNDALPDDKRQELKFCLPNGTDPLAGTARDGLDEQRGFLALDWLLRTYTPAWLDLAGLAAEASALREFRRIADLVAARAIRPHVDAARAAAWAAVRAAAGAAARAAAGAAAGAAARAAAGDTVWDAAWAAARDAAWGAAGDAAGDAARDAAWAAARDAAWGAAGDAAWDAAWGALAPTVDTLQASAIELYRQMVFGPIPQ